MASSSSFFRGTNCGFEQEGVFETFADWEEITSNIDIFPSATSYEGNLSAEFESLATAQLQEKEASLSQNVTVTPGCFLALSFADNLLASSGPGFNDLNVRASVSYDSTNLINIEIDYDPEDVGKGFVFHQKVADHPLPSNVSSVTVRFFVQITDLGPGTQWLLDGVSLRAV